MLLPLFLKTFCILAADLVQKRAYTKGTRQLERCLALDDEEAQKRTRMTQKRHTLTLESSELALSMITREPFLDSPVSRSTGAAALRPCIMACPPMKGSLSSPFSSIHPCARLAM
jgi:hypothetical protein